MIHCCHKQTKSTDESARHSVACPPLGAKVQAQDVTTLNAHRKELLRLLIMPKFYHVPSFAFNFSGNHFGDLSGGRECSLPAWDSKCYSTDNHSASYLHICLHNQQPRKCGSICCIDTLFFILASNNINRVRRLT